MVPILVYWEDRVRELHLCKLSAMDKEGAMPKEYINGDDRNPDLCTCKDLNEGCSNCRPLNRIKVTWNRLDAGGVVQITTFKDDTTYESEHELPMYVTLDREGINRTIRILRRARDQAYGRDE